VSDVLALSYHAVSPTWPAALSVKPGHLEAQLRNLLARGYRGATVSPETVNSPPAGRTLVVTFDDSYRSVFQLAFPILSRLELPATVYVPTAFVGSKKPMSWPGIEHWVGGPHEEELRPMSWEELGRLADAGWEIGSHTRSHPRLTQLDDATLEAELRESRELCERCLGRPCRTFAYPYGDQDERVVQAVRAAGYEVACTTPAQLGERDPLLWPRIGVYHDESDVTFRAKVSPSVRRLRRTPVWPPIARALLRARGRGEPLP
jgi:peptidoglycan/xylan/chitin deacetylase (PgdA/CDA1 family)